MCRQRALAGAAGALAVAGAAGGSVARRCVSAVTFVALGRTDDIVRG
jgi:hypothetical protein